MCLGLIHQAHLTMQLSWEYFSNFCGQNCPDIAFSIHQCARCTFKHTQRHEFALTWSRCFLKGTKEQWFSTHGTNHCSQYWLLSLCWLQSCMGMRTLRSPIALVAQVAAFSQLSTAWFCGRFDIKPRSLFPQWRLCFPQHLLQKTWPYGRHDPGAFCRCWVWIQFGC